MNLPKSLRLLLASMSINGNYVMPFVHLFKKCEGEPKQWESNKILRKRTRIKRLRDEKSKREARFQKWEPCKVEHIVIMSPERLGK